MARRGIVLAGTVILDIVHMVSHWPAQESVALVDRVEYGAGGPPHNAAAALKKLQAPFPVTLQGVLGDDAYADIFAAQARGYGLDDSHLTRRPGTVTSNTQVMTTIGTGRRTFFHHPGVNALLTPDLLRPADGTAKIYYLGSPGVARLLDDGGHWPRLMAEAKAAGFITALELVPLDAAILARLVPPILPHTDICVVNDHEAASITGLPTTNDDTFDWSAAEAACARLLAMGVGQLACIHHAQGAVALARGGRPVRAAAVHVPAAEIVGTVGAGDAFYAGMLLGLHEDWPLEKCLALANASAATSLQSATTSASILPWQQCLDFATAHGLRAQG